MTWKVQASQDSDVVNYINAVETADGQSLEAGVKLAYHNFIIGCKADGIWDAIKASCILAGARTLAGALVPLKGAAPTNFNFVSGDYNRETGLIGDGSTKYLDSNRNNNDDPQNNNHNAVFPTVLGTASMLLTAGGQAVGNNFIGLNGIRNRNFNDDVIATVDANKLRGTSRNISGSFTARADGSNTVFTRTSETPPNSKLLILQGGTHRLSFYSIGESLDLALLDARVSRLMSDIEVAIP